MCRHLGWLGEPRSLADLLLAAEHSLLVQSWAPRRQRHGLMNADGWGVGFYSPSSPAPARWRSARPLWGDASFASVAPAISSTCVIAAVRSATVGMPIDESATAPFVSGRWALSHNGTVDRSVLAQFMALTGHAAAESVCDSAVLAAHVFAHGPEHLGETVPKVAAAAPAARLNLLATDGTRLLATTWGDTLSVLVTPHGVVVASEPYDDDPGWSDISDRHLVQVTSDGVTVTPLET